ncbi:MAG: hypothetical protein KAF41_06125 [Flavobacterium sp.]|nr:hypothetical protein [Flavobacterium sp.]
MAVAMAVTGAFAFNVAPEKSELLDVNGFIPQSGGCVDSGEPCTTTNTNIHCKSEGMDLYRETAGTSCPTYVWRK